jgi:hypothetical protein
VRSSDQWKLIGLFQITYLQTCPDTGKLVPSKFIRGICRDVDVACVAGPSEMGIASSSE